MKRALMVLVVFWLVWMVITTIVALRQPTPPQFGRPYEVPRAGLQLAEFAGGCFWCMEKPFDQVPGVLATTSGYTGASSRAPSYEEVSYGSTGHFESVAVLFDPKKVSYEKLLEVYWRQVDPFNNRGQFCDEGDQYRTAIFVRDDAQRQAAKVSLAAVEKKFGRKVDTRILPAGEFWPAEKYHQDYYIKNPVRYRFYRYNCGRDARLAKLWGE